VPNISTAAPVISNEFGFDKVTMGIIFSAFVWAYALFQVPGGWLNDRFGPRRVLAIIVAYWSVMTAATAAATGAVSFVFVRFLFGIGEGGAFPGATRAMQLWYPRHERGFCQLGGTCRWTFQPAGVVKTWRTKSGIEAAGSDDKRLLEQERVCRSLAERLGDRLDLGEELGLFA
jgi:MFS family permease